MKVKCIAPRGYYNLTEGREYEVVELIPETPMEGGYVFPRYIVVTGDDGKPTQCHACRFETLDGVSCEDYIKNNITDGQSILLIEH